MRLLSRTLPYLALIRHYQLTDASYKVMHSDARRFISHYRSFRIQDTIYNLWIGFI